MQGPQYAAREEREDIMAERAQFNLVAPYQATGDQPDAIERLVQGLGAGHRDQTLLGVTGSGKTFTVASVIERWGRPTLVIAHNKTLAAQLYSEFREFFPDNAVEYFVSYYDYYQPEAYIPRTDTYIEKDASINEEIEKLRLAAAQALLTRNDVIIVASVSCIYNIGDPSEYGNMMVEVARGQTLRRDNLLRRLVAIYYDRNDISPSRGKFRVRGDTVDIFPAYTDTALRLEFWGDEVERITEIEPLTGEVLREHASISVYPARHFVTRTDVVADAISDIELELEQRLEVLRAEDKLVEAQRLEMRTRYDIEMIQEMGFCSGIENYSRHLARRPAGERPWCLLDYFPDDFLLVIDESHMTIPQIRGMFNGDRSRKEVLVDYGFRLPSALDNRPLKFEEFESLVSQVIYTSATPAAYELQRSAQVVEQIIRPTGLVDPEVSVRPTRHQIDDLLGEIQGRVARGERTLVTTLTKRMAEDLSAYLSESNIKVHYLHSEVNTLERVEILRDLRLGKYDVVVGVNLLREGLDLPEVSLVAVLDADKEGFLRSEQALIQTIGRAARHVHGQVILYGDVMTDSMRRAIGETNRRRAIQVAHNTEHGIEPTSIIKAVHDLTERVRVAEAKPEYNVDLAEIPAADLERIIAELEKAMRAAAAELEFEKAAALRDQIQDLRRQQQDLQAPEWEQLWKLRGRVTAPG